MKNSLKWLKKYFQNNYLIFLLIFTLFIKGIVFGIAVNMDFCFPALIRIFFVNFLIIFVLLFPFSFLKKKKHFSAYIIINSILSILLFIDLLYFSFYNSLPSLALLGISSQVMDVIPAISELLNPFYFLLFADVVIAVILRLKYKQKFRLFENDFIPKKTSNLFNGLLLLVTFFWVCLFFYADWNKFFISAFSGIVSNDKVIAGKYGVFAAHVLDVYRTVNQNNSNLTPKEKEQIVTWINENKYIQSDNDYTGIARNKNVILIQVESLQSFVLNSKINGQEITPNLNKFIAESHYFENNFFQIGAGSSSDADFTANTSLYPLRYEVVFNKYNQKDYTSLPKSLKQVGYSAYAYHGNVRTFYNRDIAYSSLGYDEFFAAEDFPKKDTIDMGLNDKDFFIAASDFIEKQPKPSFSYLITLSSHYPFNIDSKYRTLSIPQVHNEKVSGYLQSIHYTDEALGDFFEELKKRNLYYDSLIMIYSDHNAVINSFKIDSKEIDTESIEGRKTPLLIKFPNQKEGVVHDSVSSNIDIMPTILNLVGARTDAPMFGMDLFSNIKNKFYSVKSLDIGSIITDSFYISEREDGTSDCVGFIKKNSFTINANECEKEEKNKKLVQDASFKLIYYNLFKFF